MRVLNDYKCEKCEQVIERFIDSTITEIECPFCTKTMNKVICAPRPMLDGCDPSLPGAYDKWARDREKRFIENNKKNS